ncbi:hypothetical protein HDU93_009924 [Gonapodya sp. JEL0774]|nr:hypothetical protein HDU93_009924 [Gonapodya sp. JEL0774]
MSFASAQLTYLSLSNNQFSGSIPAAYGSLTQLAALTIASNSLTGPIPNLSGLTKLTSLFLNDNQLSGNVDGKLPPVSAGCTVAAGNKDLYSCIGDVPRLCNLYLAFPTSGPDCPSSSSTSTSPPPGAASSSPAAPPPPSVGATTPSPSPPASSSTPSLGLIAGAAIGGAVIVLIASLGVIWFMRRRKQAKTGEMRAANNPGDTREDMDKEGAVDVVAMGNGAVVTAGWSSKRVMEPTDMMMPIHAGNGGPTMKKGWFFAYLAATHDLSPKADRVDCEMQATAVSEVGLDLVFLATHLTRDTISQQFPANSPDELPLLPTHHVTLLAVFRDGWALARLDEPAEAWDGSGRVEGAIPVECLDVVQHFDDGTSRNWGAPAVIGSRYGERMESRRWGVSGNVQLSYGSISGTGSRNGRSGYSGSDALGLASEQSRSFSTAAGMSNNVGGMGGVWSGKGWQVAGSGRHMRNASTSHQHPPNSAFDMDVKGPATPPTHSYRPSYSQSNMQPASRPLSRPPPSVGYDGAPQRASHGSLSGSGQYGVPFDSGTAYSSPSSTSRSRTVYSGSTLEYGSAYSKPATSSRAVSSNGSTAVDGGRERENASKRASRYSGAPSVQGAGEDLWRGE